MIKKLLNSKFKKDLSFSYITQAITMLFGFLQLFLINRYFGVDLFGQLAIIMSTAGIFSSLLTAKSSEAVTRFFKREKLKQNYENAKFVLLIGFSIDFITAILLVGLIYFASTFIATSFLKDIELQDEIVLYSYITFFGFLRGTLFGYLQSKEMFIKMNIITLIESFMKIVMIVTFVFIWNLTNLDDIIYSFLMASIVSFLYTIYIFLNSYLKEFKNIKLQINKKILKEYWNFNIKTFLSSSLKAGNQNIDNLIIGYFLNTESVGIYQILKKILSPVLVIAAPFSSLVYPKLISFFETNQKEKFKNIIIKISLYILIFSLFYFSISYCFLNNILNLMSVSLNNKYDIYFILLALLVVINSQMWWVKAFSNTVNPNYSVVGNLFATVYQLSVVVLITKYYGLVGMIISIVIMNILIYLYILQKVKKYVRISL
jgi:O-antigen/teichoic acid export membrane protein